LITYARPTPVPDPDTEAFWEAAKRRRLVVQQCGACGQLRFPPADICFRCHSRDFTWEEQRYATLHSWVVVVHPVLQAFADEVPFAVALVELAPGVHMPTRLVNVDPYAVNEGMPLEVTFQETDGGFTLPVFEPRRS
jgi:uncharacterized protein